MIFRQLELKQGNTVGAVNITDKNEIQEAVRMLEVPHPKTVIVLVGGAGGMEPHDEIPMRKAIGIIARLAQETQSVVLDGGTQAGIMTEIGIERERNNYSFPLVGVIFENLLIKNDPQSILDPKHTDFFLVPGDDWGDESAWISKIATCISGREKSITILINGGKISRTDVENSLLESRPTIVMRGTGRLADEITLTGNIIAVDVSQEPGEILDILRAKLG